MNLNELEKLALLKNAEFWNDDRLRFYDEQLKTRNILNKDAVTMRSLIAAVRYWKSFITDTVDL